MRPMTLLLAAAAAASLAGAAAAQPAPSQPIAPDPNAPLGSPEHPIPKDSPTPASEAWRLKAGDPNVVSNAPIPDTPSNRSKDGQPLSRGGKETPANGN
jgi:hypothetical protein